MRGRFRSPLALAGLAALLACQPKPATPAVYGPWEEGLTLVFEDPTLPQPQRSAERMQVRVARGPVAGRPGAVQLDLANARGQMSLRVQHQDGGIILLGEDGRALAQTLPPGFPATSAWTDRGAGFRVLGRAAWDGAAILPPTLDPVGVWVEVSPAQGLRRRILYLPNLGEVESLEARNGAWVCVNRLVSLGFTDPPLSKRP